MSVPNTLRMDNFRTAKSCSIRIIEPLILDQRPGLAAALFGAVESMPGRPGLPIASALDMRAAVKNARRGTI
jgi:hypothetical protein